MYDIIINILIVLIVLILVYLIVSKIQISTIKKRSLAIILFLILLSIYAYIFLQITKSRNRQFNSDLIHWVKTDQKVVALTFDDWPTEQFTPQVISTLQQYDSKWTFFLIGNDISKYPDWVKLINDAWFQIANHSYYHNRMIFMNPKDIIDEIQQTNKLILSGWYTGHIYFRSPYGKKFIDLPVILNQMNMQNVIWTIEPETYPELTNTPEKLTKYILDRVKPGDIVLLHPHYDWWENTRQALPMILSWLQAKWYQIVTLDELLSIWEIY